ncbi:MAG: hypothetical protein OXH90_02885 [Paracoccaceae bacterium]|nr:hypothetical protein [Paracoccaceae bacterium]MDE2916531.1 hypothetical protein [Paracoccaceae bacterium]
MEFTWRKFWLFIADQYITLKRIHVYIHDQYEENKKQNRRYSALFSDYGNQSTGGKLPDQHQFPINIKSFGQEASELNLGVIEITIQQWFKISNDDQYKPVLHGIRRAMQTMNGKMVF